jgi:hypothetical protein
VLHTQFEACVSRWLIHGHRWFVVRLCLSTYLVLGHADTRLSCKRPRAPFLRARHLLALQMRPLMSHANPTSTNEVESFVVTSNSATRTPQAVSNDSGISFLLVRIMYSKYWPVGRRGFGNLLVLAWQKHHQSLASHQQTRPRDSLNAGISQTPTRRDSYSYPRRSVERFLPTPTHTYPTPSLRRSSSSIGYFPCFALTSHRS